MKEQPLPEFTRVASTKDIPEGTGKSIRIDGKDIAVFNLDGSFYAIHDICPHMGGPLGEGAVDGEHVLCPWHGWMFNIKTGAFATNPAAGVDCFKINVDGDDVYVEL